MTQAIPLRVRTMSSAGVSPPLVVFDRAGVRGVDRAALDEFGIAGIALMENAAASLARVCFEARSASDPDSPAFVFCGPGNNGGDGYACARRLANAGVPIAVVALGEPRDPEGDAASNVRTLRAMRDPAAEIRVIHRHGAPSLTLTIDALAESFGAPSIIVDALLGTGLDRAPAEPFAGAVKWINDYAARMGTPVIAADIPTGLDCDSGEPLGVAAVRATATVTFAGLKEGFLTAAARPFLGEVIVADIGAPTELLRRFGRPAIPGTVLVSA
jgi:NAD(P)H-hydrate epimerase